MPADGSRGATPSSSSGKARRTNDAMWWCRAPAAASASSASASRRISRCSAASRSQDGTADQATVDTRAAWSRTSSSIRESRGLPQGRYRARWKSRLASERSAVSSARSARSSASWAASSEAFRLMDRRSASGSSRRRTSYTSRAMVASTSRTVTPLYWLITTSPVPARVLSASRTGVFDTPNCAASSVSTSACPGLSCAVRMACLIASSTYWVRDGIGAGAKVMGDGLSHLAYRVSYMTYEVRRDEARAARNVSSTLRTEELPVRTGLLT